MVMAPLLAPKVVALVLPRIVPALTDRPPEKVFAPDRASVPAAVMVTEPAPPRINETVLVPLA
jgi:hypothetical protein